tara:strand:- start:286 stop:501 length:216 start_codon:yes stop_codon:yes gene_type:complete
MVPSKKELEPSDKLNTFDEININIKNSENKIDEEEAECIECVDYFQKKMICITSILIIGTIVLVFVSILNN